MASTTDGPLVGVLALQGAFEEHQTCLEAVGCRTRQVNVVVAIVLVGRESAFVVPPPELTTCAISRTNPFLVSFVDKQNKQTQNDRHMDCSILGAFRFELYKNWMDWMVSYYLEVNRLRWD